MTKVELLKTAKPILFGTEMVKAILNNRKSVTRRPVKPKSPNACGFYVVRDSNKNFVDVYDYDEDEAMFESPQARLHIGDILYVRETWGIYEQNYMDANYIMYRADFPNGAKTYDFDGVLCDLPTWRPSIHMPKEEARIFLRVTGVTVQRVKEITEEQAIAEGFASRAEFISEFLKIYPSYTEDSWVWVIEFERVEAE